MDFKSLIGKLDSIEAPKKTPQAPTLPKSIQLNEDAELRVLSGRSTVLAETALMEKTVTAKKKPDDSVKEGAIDDLLDKQKADKDSDDSGRRKHSGSRYGGSAQKDDAEPKPEAKKDRKTAKESVELDIEEFNDKFSTMVEAAKKAPAKKAAVKKTDAKGAMNNMFGGGAKDLTKNLTVKKKDEKVKEDPNEGNEFSGALAKAKAAGAKEFKVGGKTHQVKEGAKPDFLDIDGDGDRKEPMKKAAADKLKKEDVSNKDEKVAEGKSAAQKAAQEKFKAMVSKKKGDAAEKTKESKMPPKGKKQPVKESVERQLTFKQMMKLVVESGGQQQIDPTDQTLFTWAKRVAKQKIGEGVRAEVYAGMIYERMGGRFEMYDVLNESTPFEAGVELMPFEAGGQSLDYDSIDLGSLEVDGIDYRDAPEFSDAYFSDGSHKDGTPLEDWELEALTGDYDLLNQYVVNKVY